MANLNKLNLLMCGTGEYTTGWTRSGASKSDKKIGVCLATRAFDRCSSHEI
jgi:D-galacturonate reductase